MDMPIIPTPTTPNNNPPNSIKPQTAASSAWPRGPSAPRARSSPGSPTSSSTTPSSVRPLPTVFIVVVVVCGVGLFCLAGVDHTVYCSCKPFLLSHTPTNPNSTNPENPNSCLHRPGRGDPPRGAASLSPCGLPPPGRPPGVHGGLGRRAGVRGQEVAGQGERRAGTGVRVVVVGLVYKRRAKRCIGSSDREIYRLTPPTPTPPLPIPPKPLN